MPTASLSDLSRDAFEEEYLPSAIAPDVLEANDRTLEQRLAATKMVVASDDPIPTVLGILVLCTRTRDFLPGAYVQFLRIRGTSLADPIGDESLLMPLAQDARKPMFALRPADGAIGGHAQAVQDCHRDFRALAREIAKRTGIALP